MIEAKSLTMHYGTTRAVEDVSFRVERGEILGLLGPNGAGKSTIMNILTTQIAPTSGTASIEGFDVIDQPIEVRKHTGYLPENVPLYMDMEVGEYLHFVAEGRGLQGSELRERLDWVIVKCGIKAMLRRLIAQLSKGYRQRVGLAQALVHDPKVLVLDEPTSGLDPLQIIGIRDLVKELSADKTIIVSTHILQEVEAISDRIIIINEGRIIADGSRVELQQRAAQGASRMVALKGDPSAILGNLRELPRVRKVTQLEAVDPDGVCIFAIESEVGQEIWLDLAQMALQNGWLIKDSWEQKPSLEEAFIQLTRATTQPQ
ncbi:ABC transporter ATP-binding protein [Desulfoferrobacter suflitae]|uniref:ABC transporter ATP-binding protein n=1 Tax=Desulfoferrobacter suflitae TaxID=2865782 RepID=UPI0021644DEA|nr:ABC transporter ATP-binding protein [Desulfoferrobacter suflitae]MCK8600986.1 ABC transporter ATP-binding protein [Desulfoferrobacter suflitae]